MQVVFVEAIDDIVFMLRFVVDKDRLASFIYRILVLHAMLVVGILTIQFCIGDTPDKRVTINEIPILIAIVGIGIVNVLICPRLALFKY